MHFIIFLTASLVEMWRYSKHNYLTRSSSRYSEYRLKYRYSSFQICKSQYILCVTIDFLIYKIIQRTSAAETNCMVDVSHASTSDNPDRIRFLIFFTHVDTFLKQNLKYILKQFRIHMIDLIFKQIISLYYKVDNYICFQYIEIDE